MIKYLYYFFISLLLVFCAQSVLPALGFWGNFDILLIFLIFVLMVWGFNSAFIFAVFIGLFLDIYSYLPVGSCVLVYLLVVCLANFLYKNVFINFSLVSSLILILVSTFCCELLFFLLNIFFYLLGAIRAYIIFDGIFLRNLAWHLFLNALIMIFIFVLGQTTSKKLNLAFLIKR